MYVCIVESTNPRDSEQNLCSQKFMTTTSHDTSMSVGVVDPIKLKQDLRVFWKLMNPQDCVWEIHYQIIMKTMCRKRRQFITALQFGAQVYSDATSDDDYHSTGNQFERFRGFLELISRFEFEFLGPGN